MEFAHAVRLFGALAIGDATAHPPAGAPWRIVAWLSLYRTAQRDELAEALWPGAAPGRAAGNLRTGLWRVRERFPGLVRDGGPLVRLADTAQIDVAVAVAAARTVLDGGVPDPAAVRLLVDDQHLLPGWYDDWVVDERQRFRLLRLHALERAAHLLAARGEFGAAAEAAVAAVRSEPLRESAHRALIEVHLGEGNVGEARRQYDVCAALLRRELAARPSAALDALLRGV